MAPFCVLFYTRSMGRNGASTSSLSPSCGETTRTLISWMKAVDEKGFDARRPQKQTGRPTRLTAEQQEQEK